MSSRFPKNNINLLILAFLFLPLTFAYAQEASLKSAPSLRGDSKLSQLEQQARLYRQQGLEAQSAGNIPKALSFYQKAVELDPDYAVVYNDLGVIAESTGRSDTAEIYYLKAIKADQYYLSPYSNLALLYESRRDLDRAAFYWKKRIEFGPPDDPWTERAKNRLNDLAQVSPDYLKMLEESETVNLMRQVATAKLAKEQKDRRKAGEHFKNAKKFFYAAKYKEASGEIKEALTLDPQGQEKAALREKIENKLKDQERKLKDQERKARLKEKKENVKKMREYFEYAIKDYERGNLEAAQMGLNRIAELAISPQED